MKKMNKKGFTLAELLIVVAIIAVLVAVAIPVFSTQLEKSRDSVCISNIRAAYAQAQACYLTNTNATTAVTEGDVTLTPVTGGGFTIAVKNVDFKTQADDDWSNLAGELPFVGGTNEMTLTAFNDLDTGKTINGTKTVTFTYNDKGTITGVTIT